MITRSLHLILKVSLLILISIAATSSQLIDSTQSQSVFDIMNYDEVLEMTLESDFSNLNKDKYAEVYQPAFLRFSDSEDTEQAWKIKLRPRGKFRRQTCAMPPLKLKFKKAELAIAGLANFNKLKLVTHCSKSKSEAKEWLMKEYLAYKLYNELTPNSFRVQMVKITYIDIPTGKKTKNWGFLIEDKNQLADRIGAEKFKETSFNIQEIDGEAEQLMTVFQYMIGNEDWNILMVRNLKLFKKDNQLIPVPYDFDFSGIVNADYAIPNYNYGLRAVTDRAFFETINANDDISTTVDYLKSKKKDLFSVIKQFKSLNFEKRATVANYLESFYADIDDIQVTEKNYMKGVNTACRICK